MKAPLFALLLLATTAWAEEEKVSLLTTTPMPDIPGKVPAPVSIPELGADPIWDIRPFFKSQGLKLSADDVALWCPASRVVFIRAPRQTGEFIDASLNNSLDGQYCWLDTELSITQLPDRANPNKMFRVNFRGKSGSAAALTLDSPHDEVTSVRGHFEPIIQPNGEDIDLTYTITTKGGAVNFQISGTTTIKNGEEKILWQSPANAHGIRYVCAIRPAITWQDIFTPPPKNDSAAIRAIEARLEKLKP